MSVEFHALATTPVAAQTLGRPGSVAFWALVNCVERTVALLLLLLLSPLLLALSLAIVALSRRGPLVRHERVGQYGAGLQVLKLRTMWGGDSIAERGNKNALPMKAQRDPRVTSRLAAFCRKYSLDELPQLWQVVRGEMCLVGPRPLTAQEIFLYYGSDATTLLVVKPGLSGLWQVSGRSALDRERRRQMDLYLITNWSFRLYWQILKATVPIVLSGRNAW